MSQSPHRKNRLPLAAALLIAATAVGCTQEGPARYDLSGTVTFGGEPVPAGEIYFRPDSKQGNSGPAAFAVIHQGRYQTPPGKGVVGGPHIVEIIGYDQPPAGEGAAGGQSLFPKDRQEIDFPNHDAEVDLKVGG